MSTYLNNPLDMRGCAVSDGAAVQVRKYTIAVDAATGKPVFGLNGAGAYVVGVDYFGAGTWLLEVGFTSIARYDAEEAAAAAYKAAVEAIRNGVAVFDLPTEGML